MFKALIDHDPETVLVGIERLDYDALLDNNPIVFNMSDLDQAELWIIIALVIEHEGNRGVMMPENIKDLPGFGTVFAIPQEMTPERVYTFEGMRPPDVPLILKLCLLETMDDIIRELVEPFSKVDTIELKKVPALRRFYEEQN